MAVTITDGEISAIRFLRVIGGENVPPQVKNSFSTLQKSGDWIAFVKAAQPLLPKLKLQPFTSTEVAEAGSLTPNQQDVYLFYGAISDPNMTSIKERIDGLRNWGAWDSIARFAASVPKPPYSFTATDVKRVFDPSNVVPEMSYGQAQAKTFLNTINADPKVARMKDQVQKLIEWGGWETIARIVSDYPNIPFKFSAEDVRSVVDPLGKIAAHDAETVQKFSVVWSFYSGLKAPGSMPEDDLRKVQTFFADVQARIEHGCWKSLADLVNSIVQEESKKPKSTFPIKSAVEIDTLRLVLDPESKYGSDDACSALAPPQPPAWTAPLVWGFGAYNDVKDWTTGAADSVADWTTGAADSVADWTTGAADSVADWTTGAADSVADWTTGAADSVADWTTGAADSVADWTTGAADSVADWTTGAAGSVADWTTGAAGSVAETFNPSKW
jgi:hypothetical protein